MKELDGLDLIETPSATLVPTRVATFEVLPIKMGKFKRFAALALPMAEEAMACMEGQGDVVLLIENHESALIEITGLCSSFTSAHYDEMYPDDFVALVLATLEANTDFFVKNLMPRLKDRVASIKARIDKATAAVGLVKSNA